MELPGFTGNIRAKIADDGHWLTRRKLVLFGVTLILTGLLWGLFESEPAPTRQDYSQVIDLSLPERAAPCRQGVPCSETVIEFFGFVTIPLLALLAFVSIGALLGLALQRSPK